MYSSDSERVGFNVPPDTVKIISGMPFPGNTHLWTPKHKIKHKIFSLQKKGKGTQNISPKLKL